MSKIRPSTQLIVPGDATKYLDGTGAFTTPAGGGGGGGDTSWTAPTLQNSWVNFDATHFSPAGYRKDGNGFVHLRGLIKSGVTTVGTTLFTLPTGYRPELTVIHAVASNDAFGEARVNNDGTVTINAGTSWFCLDGITFYAAL